MITPTELLTALALMMILEGLCYALFPTHMHDMMTRILQLPVAYVRNAGCIAAVTGLIFFYLLKGI